MNRVTSSGESGIKSDSDFAYYTPNTYGQKLMSESILQSTGVSYASRTETVESDRTDRGLEGEG